MTPHLRLGFPTRLLAGSLRDKVRTAATTGAAGVQFDLRSELRPEDLTETGRRQFRRFLDEQGLAFAPATFPLRKALTDPVGLEERVAVLGKAIRFAADLKATTLIIHPGSVPAEDSGNRPLFLEVVNDLARIGNHVGVRLALTTGREAAETMLQVLETVTAGPVGANLDPASCVMAGRDPGTHVTTLQGFLQHVRVRDGLKEADGSGVEVPLGRGETDWESLFAALAEIGYRGWLTPDRTAGDDPARDAAQAILFLKNVLSL